ncbi:adenine specific DNA methylase Mod [Bartonella japonica]|uniref:site-specific DNA-methyltransferase (adenine-specific) n=1 Tax=Bartonella japonica TaxID=357761 RepID=A0ABV2FP46_9HYPH
MRKLCDEVFGKENFVAQLVWEKVHTRKNSAKYFSVSHEYIICYAKHKENFKRNLLPRQDSSAYKNPDNHPKGPWKADPITAHKPYAAIIQLQSRMVLC